MRQGGSVMAASVALLALMACGVPAGNQPDSGYATSFAGPWASEFASAFERAESDFEREVLVDGAITESELQETRERFRACLEALGYSEVEFQAGGGSEFHTPDDRGADVIDDQTKTCSEESGEAAIGSLHSWMRRNPENLDESAVMAGCLVRIGAVEPSYSADDYRSDFDDPSFPDVDSFDLTSFQLCNADPLGLLD